MFIHGSAHTPTYLLKYLTEEAHRLQNVELVFITVYGDICIDKPEYKDSFNINSLFVSASVRTAVNTGYTDYVTVFLSEIPELFNQDILPVDVAMIHVSPPDAHGYCSFSVSVDIARSAVNNARYIIAQVNPNAPRTNCDGMIHCGRFNAMVYCEDALHGKFYRESRARNKKDPRIYCRSYRRRKHYTNGHRRYI